MPDSTKPPHSKRPLLVGLTGGIASGKSLVANLFAAQGVTIIDADLIARRLVEPGTPGLMAIIDHFGTALLNDQGALNRERIAQLIFSNSQSRQQLEAILHPLILQQMQQDIAAASEAPYLLVVIPLLQETGQHRLMDRVLLVDCPVEEQHRRLMQRNQISPSQAQAMIAAQASREERIAIANDTLRNSCPQDRDRLPRLVAELHQRYLQLAMGP